MKIGKYCNPSAEISKKENMKLLEKWPIGLIAMIQMLEELQVKV